MKKKRLFACSLSYHVRVHARARAHPIHFYEQTRQHKWPCMYDDDRMRDVVRRRKGWKGKKRARGREVK